jgi:hypothetical protein
LTRKKSNKFLTLSRNGEISGTSSLLFYSMLVMTVKPRLITTSPLILCVFFGHSAFGVASSLAFIFILDASSLRRQVGNHAIGINNPAAGSSDHQLLLESMGHNRIEIAASILVGTAVAEAVNAVFALGT